MHQKIYIFMKPLSIIGILCFSLSTIPTSSFSDTFPSRESGSSKSENTKNTSVYYPQASSNPYIEPAHEIIAETKVAPIKSTDTISIITTSRPKSDFTLLLKNGSLYVDQGAGLQLVDSEEYTNAGFVNKPSLIEGTTFKRDIRWRLVYNRLQPKSTQNQWAVYTISGVTTTNLKEFGYSIGVEIPIGGKMLSEDISLGKVAGSISEKFSTSTALTNQKTIMSTNTFPIKTERYPYNDYRIAIYQKEEVYTVIPGPALQDAIDKLSAIATQNHGESISVMPQNFIYPTEELRPLVTPG
ncbi:hypothetical protein CN345_11010 [Bacillus thuringiensis]|uniref:hypothetical protein n=1 Tax=Bacillus thuringiensis TaxID=1428 RepID=UPI000BF7647B|nr:hypothetical protein [Bacillus thuringiensis]PEZ37191.1 hypothetical protein CN345_11010 [Bacillus thuringiensis]PGY46315.1 hypothetical protein COE09_23760 [Bacillus thuringiensis]